MTNTKMFPVTLLMQSAICLVLCLLLMENSGDRSLLFVFFEAAAMMSDTASYYVLSFFEFSNDRDDVVLTKI